jgi:hypothetical protein
VNIESFLPKDRKEQPLPDISVAVGWDDSLTVKVSFPPREANGHASVASCPVSNLGEADQVISFAKNIIHAAAGGEIQEFPVHSDFNEAQIQQEDAAILARGESVQTSIKENNEKFQTFLTNQSPENARAYLDSLSSEHRSLIFHTLAEYPGENNPMHAFCLGDNMEHFGKRMRASEHEALTKLKKMVCGVG